MIHAAFRMRAVRSSEQPAGAGPSLDGAHEGGEHAPPRRSRRGLGERRHTRSSPSSPPSGDIASVTPSVTMATQLAGIELDLPLRVGRLLEQAQHGPALGEARRTTAVAEQVGRDVARVHVASVRDRGSSSP